MSPMTLGSFAIKKALYITTKWCSRKEESSDYEHGEKHVEGEELSERAIGRSGIYNCLFIE